MNGPRLILLFSCAWIGVLHVRCHRQQADVCIFSDESFAACSSVLANQIELYRKDMAAAALRGYDNADAIENAGFGKSGEGVWDQSRLEAAAADLRDKTQVHSQRERESATRRLQSSLFLTDGANGFSALLSAGTTTYSCWKVC